MSAPWTCPKCGEEEAVEEKTSSRHPADPAWVPIAGCSECKAVFEIDPDYSYEDGRWLDCSTLGREVKP